MTTLGIEKIALVGHDRGARVATRFAKAHPRAAHVVIALIASRIRG
ncbi:MAG: hypothetical protein QOF90_3137 [Acetobacteraceae bacterium]|nr:hypothetical protein [Acetobacteraceae bacterium]